MSVIEVRIHTIHQGKRDEFVKLYDEVLLPAQRQFGLDVLGRRSSSRRPWHDAFVPP
jgi:hypothetical protein